MFRKFQIVALDFETYWSKEYSLELKKFTTSGYIHDPKFKIQCVGIKQSTIPVRWYNGGDSNTVLSQLDWSGVALLCHNTAFDGYILRHCFGIQPAFYLDTLSMARALHSSSIRANLDSVSSYYRVGNKLPNILERTKGKRELEPELLTQLGQYCAVDVELCRLIFDRMKDRIPEKEYDLIDLSIRMFCQPVLQVDLTRARAALKREQDEKSEKITASGLSRKLLGSNTEFAAALATADQDLELPTKYSTKQQKNVFAFAKSDLDFVALKEHTSSDVQKLVEARLAVKSTLAETRAARFIEAGEEGALPVLLSYHRAHTGRWGGGNKMNLQNLKRGSELRKCILAPAGFLIVGCDSSQIEARTLAWLADNFEMMDAFRAWDAGTGPDVYKIMASEIYARPVNEITLEERFIGKVVVLAAGFGMGAEKFEYTLAAGIQGPPIAVPPEQCRKIIKAFRAKNSSYSKLWLKMEELLVRMVCQSVASFKCLQTTKDRRIELPSGLHLQYPGLEADFDQVNERYFDFRYFTGENKTRTKIYGGALTENVVQALARIIVAYQMLEIDKKYRVVMMVHDEVVCVVPEAEVDLAKNFMLEEMRKPPVWASDLPLNAEVSSGVNYE